MTVLYATAIILLDGHKVGSLASLASFVVMKRPVALVSKMPMDARAWSLKTRRCGVSCVLKVCVLENGYLKCTLWPLVYRLGVVWTNGGVSRMHWFAQIDVAILCFLSP